MTSRCAISIDLDDLDCYFRIHGLGAAPRALADAVMTRALPRAAAFLAEHGALATWFVIGRDLDEAHAGAQAARNAAALAALAARGHELGNHSYSHPYELARLPRAAQRDELWRCDRLLRPLCAGVVGFRSPGYDVSAGLLAEAAALGYRYDSSIFPAPGYYAAKAAIMAARRLTGSASGAVLTEPRALFSPRAPYRIDPERPWRRGAGPLIEIPIAVTPWLRVPVIGTSLLLAPRWAARRLVDSLADEPFNLELHGLDFADAAGDELPRELVARQPDLAVPWQAKAERLGDLLRALARRGPLVTLAELAASA